jgi:hypothetical protein
MARSTSRPIPPSRSDIENLYEDIENFYEDIENFLRMFEKTLARLDHIILIFGRYVIRNFVDQSLGFSFESAPNPARGCLARAIHWNSN